MVGHFESIQELKQFELKIPNFSSLNRISYSTPSFTFANHSWHIRVGIISYLSVYINCEGGHRPTDVSFSFRIKKSDGSLAGLRTFTYGDERNYEWGTSLEDTVSVLPSDTLTIVCNFAYGLDLNRGDTISSVQKATTSKENSEVEYLEHVILTETDVLSKNFKDLFFDGECCDAVLQVQDKEFKVHRAVLIARSSVFAAMFKHDTSEKQTGIINVPDCDVDTFQQFLEYLYSGKLESIVLDEAVHLYRTSDKYDVKELKTFCTKYMMQNLTVEEVCDVVILADEYEETELLSATQKFFNENAKQIVKTSEWENLLKINYRLANKLIIAMTESKG